MSKYQPKGWEKKRDDSGGWFGGRHVQPQARDPRPKGSQRGTVRRDGQGPFSAGVSKRPWWR